MCDSEPSIWSYRELRAKGHTRGRIERAVRSAEFVSLRRGVYAGSQACEPARTAAIHGGRLACVSAARHAGLWVLTDEPHVHVWLRGHGHTYHDDQCGCIEHWDDGAVTTAFGQPDIPRVLRQILLCKGATDFFVALESALHKELIDRKGVAWLRTHTNEAGRAAIDFARSDAESGLESLFRWRLRKLGLRVRCQVAIRGIGRVDFLIGDRLIVEVDGKENHAGDKRHKDLKRDASAAAQDYVTLRFDYAMVVHQWPVVEAAIAAQVAAGRHVRNA